MERIQQFLGYGETFYGNTLSQWAMALMIVVLSFVLARAVFWVITMVLSPLTKRTRTDLDDIIVEKVREPAGLAIALAGSRAGVETLILGDRLYNFVEGLFHLGFALNIAWVITRVYDAIHIRYLRPWVAKSKNSLDDQLLPLARKGLRIIVWSLAVVVGLNNAGYDIMAVLGGMGIGGLAFALAAKDAVANMFGGLTVMTTRPFKPGEWIRVEAVEGTIVQVGLRNSLMRDLNGYRYSIPNKSFTDTAVVNLDHAGFFWVQLRFALSHMTPLEHVERAIEICLQICEEGPMLRDKGYAHLTDMGEQGYIIVFDYAVNADESGASPLVQTMAGKTWANTELLRRLQAEGIRLGVSTGLTYRSMEGRGAWGV